MSDPRVRRDIVLYLLLATLLSGLVDALIIGKGRLGAGFGLYSLTLMWTPALAALLTCWWRGIPLAELGWRWPATRWLLAGWLIPFGYAFAAYSVVWLSGLGRYAEPGYVAQIEHQIGAPWLPRDVEVVLFTLLAGSAGVLRACMSALGEEIGWRGFLIPRLARLMSPLRVALVSGIIWSLYHVPISRASPSSSSPAASSSPGSASPPTASGPPSSSTPATTPSSRASSPR